MAYRFEGDKYCKAERFAAYSAALNDRFVARVLPDSAAQREGQSTIAARDEILAFFATRLLGV